MSRTVSAAVFCAAIAFAGPAFAGSYAFNIENKSGGALTVTVDDKSACSLAAGETCTVNVPDDSEHHYSYALAGGAKVAFSPGDLTFTETCRIDAKGAHCVDPAGGATN